MIFIKNEFLNTKVTLILLLCFFYLRTNNENKNLIFLDEIVCSKINENGVNVVFLSDSWLQNPLGAPISLEERIIRLLWISAGQEFGIKNISDGSSNEYAEEYFYKLQNEKNISRDQIKEICKRSGFSIDDVKKELNEQNLLHQCIETIINSRGFLHVNSEEIENYYLNNKEYSEESYLIQRGIYKGKIIDFGKIEKQKNKINWQNPYFVKKNELSDDFKNKIEMVNENDIITIIQSDENVHIYKLIKHKLPELISIEERYENIFRFLQNEKYKNAYLIITKELIEDESINWKNIKYKNDCLNYLNKI